MSKCGCKKSKKTKKSLKVGLKGIGAGKGFSSVKHPGNFGNLGLG